METDYHADVFAREAERHGSGEVEHPVDGERGGARRRWRRRAWWETPGAGRRDVKGEGGEGVGEGEEEVDGGGSGGDAPGYPVRETEVRGVVGDDEAAVEGEVEGEGEEGEDY